MIPYPVIAAILDVNNNLPVIFSNTTENYQEIVANCEFDFRLNFALNGGHFGHHL